MIKKKLISFFLVFIIILLSNVSAFAAINLSITPIKYEIDVDPGDIVTRKAKVTNRTSNDVVVYTGKSDFVSNGVNGVPQFIRISEMVNPNQVLSPWIDISIDKFDLLAGETKEIDFNIKIPENATPGGHYGAVFFKNNSAELKTGNEIGVNVDYGILVLVNVAGDIIVDIDISDPVLFVNGEIYEFIEGRQFGIDNCNYYDFTRSNGDKKCIDSIHQIIANLIGGEGLDIDLTAAPDKDFNVRFNIPIKNSGNTHIQPKGKIFLVDENGNELKEIGEEFILNSKGVIIGTKIVDYIPVNDSLGNILPKSDRVYEAEWKGFPYKTYNDKGEEEMKYWNPSEYYTKQNIKDGRVLMIWERIGQRIKNKKIRAIFDINYEGINGEPINYNKVKEFDVTYIEEYVGIDPYKMIIIIFFGLLLFIWLFIIAPKKRKKREEKMKETLLKNIKKKHKKKILINKAIKKGVVKKKNTKK